MLSKVTVSSLKKLKKLVPQTVEVELGILDDSPVVMTVKTYLSLQEFRDFVAMMVNAEWIGDGHTPEVSRALFDITLVNLYTNLSLPDSPIEAYDLLASLNIVDKILPIISENGQFQDIVDSIHDAQTVVLNQKTGIGGLFASLKDVFNGLDVNGILSELKDFSPDQLENLGEIREIAKLFPEPLSPNTNNDEPAKLKEVFSDGSDV